MNNVLERTWREDEPSRRTTCKKCQGYFVVNVVADTHNTSHKWPSNKCKYVLYESCFLHLNSGTSHWMPFIDINVAVTDQWANLFNYVGLHKSVCGVQKLRYYPRNCLKTDEKPVRVASLRLTFKGRPPKHEVLSTWLWHLMIKVKQVQWHQIQYWYNNFPLIFQQATW
jgi:hypothetical protein